MTARKQDSLIFKISILSIAIMQATAQSVGGILNTMAAALPNVDANAISSLSTVPNLGSLAGVFLSPFACKLFGERKVTIFAILGSIICGCAPMVLTNFTAIYVSRLLLGFFFGLYTPLIVVLLSRFYEGDKLASMVGYENAIGSVGSAICSMVAGFLVVMGWQAGFSIYLLSIIPLVLFTLFVKLDDDPTQADAQADVQDASQPAEKGHVPAIVWTLAAFLFCFFIFQLPMAYNLGNRVFESGVAGASQESASTIASTIYSFFTIIGIPVSIFFGAIRKRLGSWTLPFALVCNVIGFGLLAFSNNVPMLFAGGIFSGIAFAIVVPYTYTRVAEVSPANVVSTSTTIAMLALNIGVFCSPLILPRVAAIIADGTPHVIMTISCVGFAVFAAIMTIVSITSSKKQAA